MNFSTRKLVGLLLVVAATGLCATPTQAAIVVYDLRVDFSNTSNPNGPWQYLKGNVPLSHFTPVTQPNLPLAVANGYWGDTASSNNSAIMLTTAKGSATGSWTDNDFLKGEVLVRTTDPSGAPMNVTWTAPTAGTFTYSGFLWFANGPLGPGGNSFTLKLNNGPTMEAGSATIGQDRNNVTGMVNGLTPTAVLAGDVLSVQLDPLPGPPFGSLAGVSFTIDFTPIPEPGSLTLASLAGAGLAFVARRRRSATAGRRN